MHALQNHADLLAMQNNDLQKELDEFVRTDDVIRSGLDRKGRIENIKSENAYQERQSLEHVNRTRSQSPDKSLSRSPLR